MTEGPKNGGVGIRTYFWFPSVKVGGDRVWRWSCKTYETFGVRYQGFGKQLLSDDTVLLGFYVTLGICIIFYLSLAAAHDQTPNLQTPEFNF